MRNELTERFLKSPAARAMRPAAEADPETLRLLHAAFGPTFLARPLFLERLEVERIESALNVVTDVVFSLPERLFDGDLRRFAGEVGIRDDQLAMVGVDIQEPPVRYGRADLYFDGDRFRMLEFNLGSPVGGLQVADLNQSLHNGEHMRAFVESEALEFEDPVPSLAAMLRTFAADHGTSPVVALMDRPASYAATQPHLTAIARGLREQGVEAFACATTDIRDTGSTLLAAGRPFSVAYRFFNLNEITDSAAAAVHAAEVFDALRAYNVPTFTPMSGVLFSNKTVLAMLHSERLVATLSGAEAAAIEDVLPWTCTLADQLVEVRGQRENVLDYARHHRDSLVIKPADGNSGEGVVLGNLVSPQEWEAALRAGVVDGHVLQELVVPRAEQFATPDGAGTEPWVPLWGSFLIGREYAGTCIRAARPSESGVISLSHGARVGCVYRQASQAGPQQKRCDEER